MQRYAKAAVAVLGAVLVAIAEAYGASPLLTVLTATVTAIGVYAVPNIPE